MSQLHLFIFLRVWPRCICIVSPKTSEVKLTVFKAELKIEVNWGKTYGCSSTIWNSLSAGTCCMCRISIE